MAKSLDNIESQLPANLVRRSLEHIVLLHAVDTWPNGGLYEGQLLEEAVRRYQCMWLNQVVRNMPFGDNVVLWVPPLDVAWVWHVHRLDPKYPEYCKQAFGRVILPADPFAFTTDAKKAAGWVHTNGSARGEPFYPPRLHAGHDEAWRVANRPTVSPDVEPDLVEAVKRQASFGRMFLRLCYQDRTYLELARQRYAMFLNLARTVTGHMIVPMYDIDLMWHTHISLDPAAYPRFCLANIGRPFKHDDETLGDGREEGAPLTEAYQATKKAWEAEYPGEPYDIPGSNYIPPQILHPVVEKFAKAEGYLGRPLTQRTGAWALYMQRVLLTLRQTEETKAAKGGFINRLKRGKDHQRQRRAQRDFLRFARRLWRWQMLPHDSDHAYWRPLLAADATVLAVGRAVGPSDGVVTGEAVVMGTPVPAQQGGAPGGGAYREHGYAGEEGVFRYGDGRRWDADKARRHRLWLYGGGFVGAYAFAGLGFAALYYTDWDYSCGMSCQEPYVGADGCLDGDCAGWVDGACGDVGVNEPMGGGACGGGDGGAAFGGECGAGGCGGGGCGGGGACGGGGGGGGDSGGGGCGGGCGGGGCGGG